MERDWTVPLFMAIVSLFLCVMYAVVENQIPWAVKVLSVFASVIFGISACTNVSEKTRIVRYHIVSPSGAFDTDRSWDSSYF